MSRLVVGLCLLIEAASLKLGWPISSHVFVCVCAMNVGILFAEIGTFVGNALLSAISITITIK